LKPQVKARCCSPGLLEAAGEGTVLLDDINQMSPQMQSKVLRVLQEREVRRVGGVQTLPVAARILCATNEDLRAMVQSGTFRQDLYYRISVIPLRLPPLRERQEDVPALAACFLQRFCREKQRQVILGDAALDLLCRFDWPGNIRQLENEIERAVVFAEEGGTIQPEDLSEEIRITAGEPTGDQAAEDRSKRRSLTKRLASYERYLVLQALAAEDGNVSRTARRLGMTRQGLQQKLKRLGLARPGSKKTPPNLSHEQDAP
jgi:transcriptional regulator with PAS, ATPase and Fis domain